MRATGNVYISPSREPVFRRQAWLVWGVAVAVVFLWMSAIIAAPIAKAVGIESVASVLYRFFSLICHQIPARSFFIDGEPLGVCSRCFGVYSGLFTGLAVYPLWRRIDLVDPIPRFWLFLAMVPIAVDWSLTILGIWENTFTSRYLTGFVLGFACATYIAPAVVEISRNFSMKRSHLRHVGDSASP